MKKRPYLDDPNRRDAAHRVITKQDAIRHLLHASIRLLFKREDIFAIHLLASSCEKLLYDWATKTGKTLTFSWDNHLKPEHASEFFSIYRETYNYFKHSDFDFDQTLGVHGIVQATEVQIWINTVNYVGIFENQTKHIYFYQSFIMLVAPELMIIPKIEALEQSRVPLSHMDRATVLETYLLLAERSPEYMNEVKADLVDISAVSGLTVSDYRHGNPQY